MKIKLHNINNIYIAEIVSNDIVMGNVQDALDLMANCDYQGARIIVINRENIIPTFFDLKTRIAGNILQKFSNYKVKLAIVGNFSENTSKILKDFIYESNKSEKVIFIETVDAATDIFSVNHDG